MENKLLLLKSERESALLELQHLEEDFRIQNNGLEPIGGDEPIYIKEVKIRLDYYDYYIEKLRGEGFE